MVYSEEGDEFEGESQGGRLLRTLSFFVAMLFLASALVYPIRWGESPQGPSPLSSDWTIEVVDSPGWVGFHNSIAVDANGIPHMSYMEYIDSDNEKLKYAKWTGTGWSNETVDIGGGFSSIALDSSGNPHIGHSQGMNPDHNLSYSRLDGGVWLSEIVDSTGNVGYHVSLTLDANDWPRMSYVRDYRPPFQKHEDRLKHAAWNGSAWNIEVVESLPDGIGGTSIAVDSIGYTHISYSTRVGENSRLKYARWNGSTWNIETVDAIDTDDHIGYQNDLALDGLDRPHIAYHDTTNRDLKYAWWNGSAWNISLVDSAGRVGGSPSIVLDGSDRPHIGYLNTVQRDVKYAWWNGSGWSIETVDFDGVFSTLSLALDDDDLPHISYHDWMNMDLKYATKAKLPSPLGSISFDIDPDTLNLKSEGRWVTAYVSAENASVFDIDVSSILLQDALAPERWDYQGDVLMLKFNRQDLIAILEVGESVEIKLSGKWNDGSDFEAYDYIRVTKPGRWIDFP